MAQRSINLPIALKTKSWKGLDANSFKILSEDAIKEAVGECEYLCEPLSMSFGPYGLGIMMYDLSGLTITKIGSQILNIFDRGDSPVRDFLLKSINSLETVTGDGIKTYLILLTFFLKNILKYKKNRLEIYLQLNNCLSRIECLTTTRFELTDFDQIIHSFFYTRFTSPVSLILSNLFKQWIQLNSNFGGVDTCTFLLDNFDALVYHKQNNMPLDESKIEEGITLSGHYIGRYPKDAEQARLKVVYYPDDNKDDEVNVNVEIARLVDDLQDVKQEVLVIINNQVPPSGRHLLRERNVNLLMLAVPEMTRLLSQYAFNYRRTNGTDPIVRYSCSLLSFTTDLTITLPVFQLQICAPSKTYMKSYTISLRNCLTLCRFTLDTKSLIIKAGKFEELFAVYFAAVFSKNELPIHLDCRKELLKWHENLENARAVKPLQKDGDHLENIIIDIMLNLKSMGLKVDNEVVTIISEGLMGVAKRIPDVATIGYEPLSLKLTILQRALSTLLTLINIDKIVKCKTINCEIDTDEFSDLQLSDTESDN